MARQRANIKVMPASKALPERGRVISLSTSDVAGNLEKTRRYAAAKPKEGGAMSVGPQAGVSCEKQQKMTMIYRLLRHPH